MALGIELGTSPQPDDRARTVCGEERTFLAPRPRSSGRDQAVAVGRQQM
jgi:hypothetical protein